ncbi:aldo-keto reductase family 1 member A1-like isoform X2 [Watersipora subatra]|uniref:aldo-keto reductase family 1 member A1-like isoform X2 n=1 Tax=Watersipora subatra TaxID=2589382 RepID=UPI00355C0D9B
MAAETMRTAIDIGYRHIDIAQNYDNEDKLGQVLEEQIEAGKLSRKDVFITTKLSPIAYAPEHVRRETEKSLKRLRTDYIDLYLMHFPVSLSDEGIDNDPPTRFPTYENGTLKTTFVDHMLTWKEMEKLVDDGLVKAIGLTNFTMKQTQRIYTEARIKPANVQIEIHAWFPQYDLVEFCLKRGISVTAYGPTGSPDIPDCIKMGPPVPPLLNEPLLKEIAGRHKKTPSQVLLRNLIQRGIAVIPKCVAEEEMMQNLQVFDFQLTEDEMLEIKGLNKELRIFVFKMFGKQNFRHPYFPWPELIDQCEI